MFQKAHAEPYFEFELPRYEGSINPELDPMEFGINPFYAGRPLEDMAYLDGWWAFTKWLVTKLSVIGFGIWLLWEGGKAIWNMINWFIEIKYRAQFKNFLVDVVEQYGVIGGTYCKPLERTGKEYVQCLKDRHKALMMAFIDEARQCEGGRHPNRYRGFAWALSSFEFTYVGNTEWACWQNGYRLEPLWDASGWL